MRRSKEVTWDQIRVGLVLLIGLTVLALGFTFIGGVGNVYGNRYELVTLMTSAAGLVPGAPVQVAGQNAGQVDRIEFIRPEDRPQTGEAVAVWLAVNVAIRDQIRADSRARVRTQGLLGDRLIDIEPGSPDARTLTEGDTLESAPALSYEELLGQAADAVEGLIRLSENLTAVTDSVLTGHGTAGRLLLDDQLYVQLVELSAGLNDVLAPMARGEGLLGRMMQDEELYDRLVSTATSLDTLTRALAAGEGTLGRLLRSDSLYRALARSSGRVDSLLAAVERGDGTVGRFMTDEALYDEVLRSLVDLNALLQDLRENPRKYIPPVEIF